MQKKQKKIWKLILVWPIIAILLAFIFVQILGATVFYFDFMRPKVIHMERFDTTPCQMEIPVRYIDSNLTTLKNHSSIYTKDNWRYSLRKSDSTDEAWITICRWGLGGLAVYTARYEITDPSVKKKLLELWADSEKTPLN